MSVNSYEKILLQTISNFDPKSVERLTSMLSWIAYAKRPLKKIELQSAITFSSGKPLNEDVVPSFVLGLCSQLVEERADSTLALIHSSVKEYVYDPLRNIDTWLIETLGTCSHPVLCSRWQSKTFL